jgi:hypothetical protein
MPARRRRKLGVVGSPRQLPVAALLGAWLLAVGCGSAAPEEPALREPPELDAGPAFDLDADDDGLCDVFESDFGADPMRADTDGDGLPDLVEIANTFDPTGPDSPAADQVGLLQARRGATLEMSVRTTVDGDGQGLTGFFEPVSSTLWPQPGSVRDYFVSAVAVSADPTDNVRRIDFDSERFDLVQGQTRLGFSVLFEYPDEASVDCARGYPFRYRIKDDAGENVAQRVYLLVVAPEAAGGEIDYCLPPDCL